MSAVVYQPVRAGGSHSHQKRLQLTQRIQQKAQQAASSQAGVPTSPLLSGIPPASGALKHSASQPTLYQAGMFSPFLSGNRAPPGSGVSGPLSGGQPSFRAGSTYSRSTSGFFSCGGVSARYGAGPPVVLGALALEGVILPPGSGRRSTLPPTLASFNKGVSRSLGASKASLVSYRSGKTSIQQEAHDREVRQQLRDPAIGQGRMPFRLSWACFILFGLIFMSGVIVIILRQQGTLFLSLDKGEIIGPVLMAGSFIFVALGVRFAYTAYQIRSKEVQKLRFFAANATHVGTSIQQKKVPFADVNERIFSGTVTKSAVARTPVGSRTGSVHSLVST